MLHEPMLIGGDQLSSLITVMLDGRIGLYAIYSSHKRSAAHRILVLRASSSSRGSRASQVCCCRAPSARKAANAARPVRD